MDKHHIAHYLIAAVVVVGGAFAFQQQAHRIDTLPQTHVERFAYPGLAAAQQDHLQTALAALGKRSVTVWCGDANCKDLAEDIQYVAYEAGWGTQGETPLMAPDGLTVSPNDPTGAAIAEALGDATGLKVSTVAGDAAGGYNISLGKKALGP